MTEPRTDTWRLILGIVGGVFFIFLGFGMALFVWWATANSENPGPLVFFPILLALIGVAGVVQLVMSIAKLSR